MPIVVPIVALLIAGGCRHSEMRVSDATPPVLAFGARLPGGSFIREQWTKPRFDSAEWMRDTRDCSERAKRAAHQVERTTDTGSIWGRRNRDLWKRCMRWRGYRSVRIQ